MYQNLLFFLSHFPSKPDIHFKLSTWRNLSYISYYVFIGFPREKTENNEWTWQKANREEASKKKKKLKEW